MPSHATIGRIKWPPLCCPSDMRRRQLSSLLADRCKQNAFPSQTPHGLRYLLRSYHSGIWGAQHRTRQIPDPASHTGVGPDVQITSIIPPTVYAPHPIQTSITTSTGAALEKAKCTTARLARAPYFVKTPPSLQTLVSQFPDITFGARDR